MSEQEVPITVKEAGRRGGEETLKRHGRDHYVKMGKAGGRFSSEEMSERGKRGMAARWGNRKKEEKETTEDGDFTSSSTDDGKVQR